MGMESNAGGSYAMRKVFIICPAPHPSRSLAVDAVLAALPGYVVKISEPTRTLDDNAAQWPILDAFAKQLQWPVNGKMVYMEPEEWKDVLTAAFKRETVRLAMGLDGGVVMIGQRTSKFTKSQWPEWKAFLKATAADRGVEL